MPRRMMITAAVMVGMMVGAVAMSRAQLEIQPQAPPPPGRGAFAGMQRVQGEVTAVAGPVLTVKTEDGATMQIVTTDNTRVIKGSRQPQPRISLTPSPGAVLPPPPPGRNQATMAKVSDLKVGDYVMAAGNLDAPNKTLHAAMVVATDAAQLQALRENLGKTYIGGRVTAIDLDNAKMTVERPDHVSQTIGFDETTSFRRGGRGGMGGVGAESAAEAGAAAGGESITLADIKVGDVVSGRGSVKGGVFVPTELVVGGRGQGGRRRGGEGAASAPPGPGTVPGSAPEPQ